MCGIYKITNKTTNRFYIGSSNNIERRWKTHSRNLKAGNHHNLHLQRSWLKYGETDFEFEVVEKTTPEQLVSRENYYLVVLQPFWRSGGYNIGKTANGGDNFSNNPRRSQIIAAITATAKRRFASINAEERKKISERVTGKRNPNYGKRYKLKPHQKIKLAKYHKEHPKTDEQKTKIKTTVLAWWTADRRVARSLDSLDDLNPFFGRKHTQVTKDVLSAKAKGKRHSDETRKKISAKSKQFYTTTAGKNFKLTLSRKMTGRNHFLYGVGHTPAAISKMRMAAKTRWCNAAKLDLLKMPRIKVVMAAGKIYLTAKLAARSLNISQCALTFRCKSKNIKWREFQFTDKATLTSAQISQLVWR